MLADAFGNALGNSIVGKLSQPKQQTPAEQQRAQEQYNIRKQGATALEPDIGKFSPITDPDAWSLDKALQKMSQKQKNEASGWVNGELIGYELNEGVQNSVSA